MQSFAVGTRPRTQNRLSDVAAGVSGIGIRSHHSPLPGEHLQRVLLYQYLQAKMAGRLIAETVRFPSDVVIGAGIMSTSLENLGVHQSVY